MSTVVATNIARLRSRTEGFYGQGFGVLGSGSCLGAVSIYRDAEDSDLLCRLGDFITYRGYIGITEKKIETTITDYIGFRA